MLFYLVICCCVLSGILAVVTFILYVQARMNEKEIREKQYRSIHFMSLLIFVFFGVVILVMLSNRNL